MSGDTANTALDGRHHSGAVQGALGLARGSNTKANHLSPPVNTGTNGLVNFCADSRGALSKFRYAVARRSPGSLWG
ncbi:hypothetical protein [Microcoleus sp. K4-B3]|uniref:hypothetical protein n=1 Tax=Microcoleus sp. K4-B3 TaxID=2818791 RepID=UPI002FD490A5